MTNGAPLGNHNRHINTDGSDMLMEHRKHSVHLGTQKIEIRCPGLNQRIGVLAQSRKRSSCGVQTILFMNHLGNVVDRIPNFGIGMHQIQFITDHPTKQRRMVFISTNSRPCSL